MGTSRDLNCFKIEYDDEENYYFKIENVFS